MQKIMNDIDELMAQFRELETGHVEKNRMEMETKSPRSVGATSNVYSSSSFYPKPSEMFSSKTWFPFLVFASGLLIWTIVFVSICRPRFLYTPEDHFMWKRYFLSIFVIFLLLILTIIGLYKYITGRWIPTFL